MQKKGRRPPDEMQNAHSRHRIRTEPSAAYIACRAHRHGLAQPHPSSVHQPSRISEKLLGRGEHIEDCSVRATHDPSQLICSSARATTVPLEQSRGQRVCHSHTRSYSSYTSKRRLQMPSPQYP